MQSGHAGPLSLKQLFAILFVSCGVLFGISAVAAWTGPTAAPPGGNVAAPINVGTVDQVKNGGLGVNALAVFGDELIQADGHLNFGSTSGDSGYGFRDDNGVMEYKDASGQWTSFDSLAGGSGTNGTNGTNGTSTPAPQTQVFTYSTPGTSTWTKPSSGTNAIIQCWGGGGGGAGFSEGGESFGAGGGGGGYVTKTIPLSELPSTVTVTVGAGGQDANNGGNSSFGSYVTAYGGSGSTGGAIGGVAGFGIGGAGGGTSGGTGENGGPGGSIPGIQGTGFFGGMWSFAPTPGTSTSCSGAGGGATYDGAGRTGGTSGCGGNGGTGPSAMWSGGNPGAAPGGGGSGGGFNGAGAAGGNGECVITTD